MTKTPFLALAGLCLSASVAGCTSLSEIIPQTVNPELAESPYYPGAYSDGCNSAIKAEQEFSQKLVRNEYLFENEKGYAYGWRQGFAECQQKDPLSDSGGLRTQRDPF